MIKLAEDTIDKKDMDLLSDWIRTYPKLTKGELTVQFENKWSSYIGTKYSTFVNSGSSANLLMLYALMESKKIKLRDKIVVPALSWATDLAPVIQLGLTPILCDCNNLDYSLDLDHLKQIIKDESPKAIILVSVLGFIPDMNEILNICQENDIVLLEDCCESLGSEYKGKKLGSFGLMSSYSCYFGHHISTIEGGIICTSDEEMNAILKSIRNHGWDRDWDNARKIKKKEEWQVDDFDTMYTFYHAGFNVRATDLQAFIGLGQLDKIDNICKIRNRNYLKYCFNLGDIPQNIGFVSNFAYPIVSERRLEIVKNLKSANVECRPLICGSMGSQPMYVSRYGARYMKNAEHLKKFALYAPNHQNMSLDQVDFICDLIKKI
jgi:CDP-6-deoxy-D-xylo-4-hexulose-3-dehydrase